AGTAVPEMLEQAGLADGGVYRTNRCQDITAVFQKLVLLFNLERRQSGLGLHGLFHSLLSVIADDLHGIKYDTSGKLAPALNQMLADYNKKIDIARYALLCNLSKSRFMHLFKEATGVSPYRYQLGIRIQRAEKLLLETGMSVSEIAASVGFDDPLYFSRIFKIFTGEAPRRYKRTE
ncbi:MAG TPA: AraC family transcriptional regulator, partial [Armatimonadota bacterium]|nr:AraC family transcriptional regulator [Armatimonadota bacterium]